MLWENKNLKKGWWRLWVAGGRLQFPIRKQWHQHKALTYPLILQMAHSLAHSFLHSVFTQSLPQLFVPRFTNFPTHLPTVPQWELLHFLKLWLFFFFFFFCLFRGAPTAYGSSQARGWIGTIAAGLCHSHSNARSTSATYVTAHSNSGSLTHE